jgi:hypothetical protein
LGLRVSMERFGSSGHVAHMIANEERYWEAVKKAWGLVR